MKNCIFLNSLTLRLILTNFLFEFSETFGTSRFVRPKRMVLCWEHNSKIILKRFWTIFYTKFPIKIWLPILSASFWIIFVKQRMRQIERNIVDLERSITSERTKINSRFGKDEILLWFCRRKILLETSSLRSYVFLSLSTLSKCST